MPLRLDLARYAAHLVDRDLKTLGVTQRRAALVLGVGKSTLNDFLNATATKRGNQRRILEQILECPAWEKDTRIALVALLDFDHLARAKKIPQISANHAAE